MPKPAALTKAELIEMKSDLINAAPGTKPVRVQFNPETLKVTYSNQLVTGDAKSAQKGTEAMQYVGKGSTKLAVQLWFDVNHPSSEPEGGGEAPRNVRDLTSQVAYFITPKPDGKDPETFTIPAVKFNWGTFSFIGVMDSLDETLELFSADGRPLRASLSVSLTQQAIKAFEKDQGMRLPKTSPGNKPAGTVPLTSALAGASVQSLAEGAIAGGKNWQDIAAANGIENPRLLAPGQLIDINAKVRAGI